MKKFLIKGFIATLGILLLASIFGIWFYWFQWRPTEIRKQCVGELRAELEISDDKSIRSVLYPEGSSDIGDILYGKSSYTEANNFYRGCLVKQGMKPESLFIK